MALVLGKTTLAKTLEDFFPYKFKRTLEFSTRAIRPGEVNMVDYEFIDDWEFKFLKDNDQLFEYVEYQFAPNKYGAKYSELDDEKWNVLVVSIEGLLQGMRNIGSGEAVLINILIDEDLDINRESRAPKTEENYNMAILNSMKYGCNEIIFNGSKVQYEEIKYSKLKNIRNDRANLESYFKEIGL